MTQEARTTQAADLARAWDPGDDATAEDPYELWRSFRSSETPLFCEKYDGYYVVSKYADVREVMLDTGNFISSKQVAVPPHTMPNLPPLEFDPPEHRELRGPLNSWFSPKSVERMEPEIRAIAVDLLLPLQNRREFDFIADFAIPLPREITWQLIRLPAEDKAKVRGWFQTILRQRTRDLKEAKTAYDELFEYLAQDLERRRTSPRDEDDVIAMLLDTTIDGKPLSNDQMVMYYFQILIAGLDTTTAALGMAICYLAEHPEAAEQLRANPELLPSATEEFLRVYSPIAFIGRTVAADTEFKGCPMKAGDRVAVLFGSANSDETEFPDADQIKLDRHPNRHLAFGAGIHRCLGSNLARSMILIGLTEFFARMGDFRLSETEAPVWEMNGDIRTMDSLPLLHTPRS